MTRRSRDTLAVVPPAAPPPPLSAGTPPGHLSAEAQQLWKGYTTTWLLDHGGLVLLQTALESFDLQRRGQAALTRDGIVVGGRPHPAVAVVRDARIAMLRALGMLGLDVEPPGHPGRPPGR